MFVLGDIKMYTLADITMEKEVEKMRHFKLKYSKQAGTLPQASTLQSMYVSRAFFKVHFRALKDLLKESAAYNC